MFVVLKMIHFVFSTALLVENTTNLKWTYTTDLISYPTALKSSPNCRSFGNSTKAPLGGGDSHRVQEFGFGIIFQVRVADCIDCCCWGKVRSGWWDLQFQQANFAAYSMINRVFSNTLASQCQPVSSSNHCRSISSRLGILNSKVLDSNSWYFSTTPIRSILSYSHLLHSCRSYGLDGSGSGFCDRYFHSAFFINHDKSRWKALDVLCKSTWRLPIVTYTHKTG